jgi:tetratricopeptide (TPR) repeat protein
MKNPCILLFSMFFTASFAQGNYEKGMTRAMQLMKTDYTAAGALFERIAAAEKEEWLPAYYAAYYHINNSWGQHPKEKTLNHLNKAKEYLEQAESISPENPEIMVMRALLNTAWITYDGSVYGMKLSGPTTAIYKKALAMAPNNPRVVSNHAQWMIGSARYFGKDVREYCQNLERAIELYEKEKVSGFEPSWGLERTQEALEDCKG